MRAVGDDMTTADAVEAFLRRRHWLLSRLARVDAMLGRIESYPASDHSGPSRVSAAGIVGYTGDAAQLTGGLRELRASLQQELEQIERVPSE